MTWDTVHCEPGKQRKKDRQVHKGESQNSSDLDYTSFNYKINVEPRHGADTVLGLAIAPSLNHNTLSPDRQPAFSSAELHFLAVSLYASLGFRLFHFVATS
ncbi:hypothetical protein DPEC_G00107260 [Dallia pectoralis]|uniref:Uncharacterized protein n=1 Tax=Dallia pectoralis TaxID=75939 RepID=A0ACC2GS11_DALPE|nr:hypothetical protein DPEC_G00107260 [Dallia pectoralis]